MGTRVVDMFDASSKKLIWRATSGDALPGNDEEDTQTLVSGSELTRPSSACEGRHDDVKDHNN